MKVGEPLLPCYLVEWYRLEIGEAVDDAVAQLDTSAASMSAGGASVQLLMTLAVPADDVVFGVFAADSAEAVAQACQRAGFPTDRLTAATSTRLGLATQFVCARGGRDQHLNGRTPAGSQ